MQSVDALVCTAPGKLQIEKRPAPRSSPDHALVRPRRIGICGTDYHIYEGSHPYLKYPRIMGHELAVEVVEAPPGSGFAPGQICVVNPYLSCGHCVACRAGKFNCCVNISVLGVHQDGGMTELLALPAGNLLHAEGLTADQCATVEFLAIGAHGVRRAAVRAGQRCLVIGAGPIGLGAAIFAQIDGAAITIMDRDSGRIELAKSIIDGANFIVAGVKTVEAVAEATKGDGFDVVVDATGNRTSMESAFGYVAHGGSYVLLGLIRESIAFSHPEFHKRETTLLSSRNALRSDFETVMGLLATGRVPLNKLITHRTTLADAVENLPRWTTEKQGLVKALIEVR